ncbi:MAG: hypothetical protein ABSG65_26350 [Bryobacteraceae bacterium]|jgi:hypothetical protein
MKTDKPERTFCPAMTTSYGRPVGDSQNSVAASSRGLGVGEPELASAM